MKRIILLFIFLINILSLCICYAQTEIIKATGTYTVGDGPDENISVAKERARLDAMRVAAEQVGVYIESSSEIIDMKLTKDEVKAVAAKVLKIQSDTIKPTVNGDVITYVCTITALVDTSNVELASVAQNKELIQRNVELEKKISELQKENIELKQHYKNTTTESERNEIQEKIKVNESLLMGMKYYNKACDYLDNNDYNKAIEYFNHSIEMYPSFLPSYMNRGISYMSIGNSNMGIKDFDYVIYHAPTYSMAYYNRGAAYDDIGQYSKAIDDYTSALNLNPKYYSAVLNRGISYVKSQQFNLAIIDFSAAINWADSINLPIAYRTRGLLYCMLGKKNEAIRDLEKSLSLKYDITTLEALNDIKGNSNSNISSVPMNQPTKYTF